MTTIALQSGRDCINSLGIPVDNLSLEQAVDRIVSMARIRDGRSRLVSTLNVDFLVNSLGCAFSRPRHPELLNVLRNSEMVTADGFPIVWLSRLVGKPLKARVTGADIVPALSTRAAQQGLSLFLMGGAEGAADAAANKLMADNPGLIIAGSAAPYIHTTGEKLADYDIDDEPTLRKINESGADILLVGLGNPKQELWFNRNRDKLKVPVAIGVGGTFEFINGTVRRAPHWVQQANLEWLFRITQDPARLWQRYSKGLLKLGVLTAPLLYYRLKDRVFVARKPEAVLSYPWQSVWSSRSQSLAVLRLPRVVTLDYLSGLLDTLEQKQAGMAMRLLDFSAVRHIDSSAQHEFFRLGELLHSLDTNIVVLGMSRTVKRHLAAGRIMDLIGENGSGTALNALSYPARNDGSLEMGCQSYVMSQTTLIFLSGRVSSEGLAGLGFVECMHHAARDRTCILDMRNVALLESTAIALLQQAIADIHAGSEGAVLLSGAGANIRQMFRMAGFDESVVFIDDKTLLTSIAVEGNTLA